MTKGAPQVIAKLCGAEDKPEMKMRVEAEVANLGSRGIRSLAVARTVEGARVGLRAGRVCAAAGLGHWGLRGPRPPARLPTRLPDSPPPPPPRAGGLEEWELLGMLTFLDPPRPDTKRTIEQALENGVDVKMITGDQVRRRRRACSRLPAALRAALTCPPRPSAPPASL